MEKEDILKLIDICDSAIMFLKADNIIDFDTFQHGNIKISDAEEFINTMFDITESMM